MTKAESGGTYIPAHNSTFIHPKDERATHEREHRELNETTRRLSLVGLVEHNCKSRPGGAGRGALVAGATSFAQNSSRVGGH